MKFLPLSYFGTKSILDVELENSRTIYSSTNFNLSVLQTLKTSLGTEFRIKDSFVLKSPVA